MPTLLTKPLSTSKHPATNFTILQHYQVGDPRSRTIFRSPSYSILQNVRCPHALSPIFFRKYVSICAGLRSHGRGLGGSSSLGLILGCLTSGCWTWRMILGCVGSRSSSLFLFSFPSTATSFVARSSMGVLRLLEQSTSDHGRAQAGVCGLRGRWFRNR